MTPRTPWSSAGGPTVCESVHLPFNRMKPNRSIRRGSPTCGTPKDTNDRESLGPAKPQSRAGISARQDGFDRLVLSDGGAFGQEVAQARGTKRVLQSLDDAFVFLSFRCVCLRSASCSATGVLGRI